MTVADLKKFNGETLDDVVLYLKNDLNRGLREINIGFQNIVFTEDQTSGIYLPILTNSTNVADSTAFSSQFLRVGDTVLASGRVNIDPTSTGNTELFVSLPIFSTFANANELAGAGCDMSNVTLRILASTTTAQISYTAVGTGNTSFSYTFTYRVI